MTFSGLFDGLFDDAAVFPPGSLPLPDAVHAHLAHRRSAYAGLVGPLVLPASDMGALSAVVSGLPDASVELALTTSLPHATEAVAAAATVPAARLVAVEVALPDTCRPADVVPALAGVLDTSVFVELPRDERRPGVLDALAGTAHRAKLRTGGVRADLYPDEAELAAGIGAAVRAGVQFKATAGLHHALRNTDPATGFEQHGFLNVLAATGAALAGADDAELAGLLAERDPLRVARLVRELPPQVRTAFRSFGTCSVTDPVADLVDLGLLAVPVGALA